MILTRIQRRFLPMAIVMVLSPPMIAMTLIHLRRRFLARRATTTTITTTTTTKKRKEAIEVRWKRLRTARLRLRSAARRFWKTLMGKSPKLEEKIRLISARAGGILCEEQRAERRMQWEREILVEIIASKIIMQTEEARRLGAWFPMT